MKKTVVSQIMFIVFFLSLKMSSQTLTPEKGFCEYNNKMDPCLMVKLDPEPTTLKKAWISFLKKVYDVKLKGVSLFSNSDLLYAKAANIDKLSPKKTDFYTNIVEDENGSEMKVFASFGNADYLTEEKYPVEFRAMNEMIIFFLKQYLPEYYNQKVDESAEKVKDLNKQITNLKVDIKDDVEHIERLNREIAKFKVSIDANVEKLNVAEKKLKGRQEKLERINSKLEKL